MAEYDCDFEGKELTEIELKIKHYDDGLTVGELKKLLENEADDNVLQIFFSGKNERLPSKPITRVIVPVAKNTNGDDVVNDTGVSLRFIVREECLM